MPSDPGTPSLPRRLGLTTATSVVVANMIGTGIFTTSGLMLERLGDARLVLACWLLGGLLALCGALCYAELAAMMPAAGAEYAYLKTIYGPRAAFLSGWVSLFVGFSAPIAASATACAAYLSAAGAIPATRTAERATAFLLVTVLTFVHFRGHRPGAAAQNLLTGLKLLMLGLFIGAGLFLGVVTPGGAPAAAGGAPSPGSMALTLLWVGFAYSGWNAAAYLGEEVRRPERTLPRALLIGTLLVTAIYMLVNLALFRAAPASALDGRIAVAEAAARALFGPPGGSAVSLLVAVALLSSLSAYILIGPRLYYAMARDGLFFRFAARIHPRFATPGASILLQGCTAALMVVAGGFEALLTYIGFALTIFPWMAVAGLMILRRREPLRPRPFRVPGYPLVPLFYLVCSAAIAGVAVLDRPLPSILAILTVAAGVAGYRLMAPRTPRPGSPAR